jgi:membrane associated rhomboid family serine protease
MAFRRYGSSIDFGFGGLTPVVRNLLIANVAVFVLAIVLGFLGYGGIVQLGMLTPYLVTHDLFLWQVVTYMFLHDGFFHILFNMFALWMFGSELERTWGQSRFLFYYFLTGIGAGITCVLLSPSSIVATLGASGAIYGLLLAYGMLFPDRMIFLYFLIPIRAKYFVMIMGAIEFLSALATPGSLVSHVAHLGGMLFGFLYLRGQPLYLEGRNRYYRWRRLRLQKAFTVYMNKKDRDQERRGPWVQ